VPGNTVSAVPGYVSVFPYGGGEAVVGADQSGWVYSINPSSGAVNWVVKLDADAIQGAVSTYLRPYFSSAMTTAYPGSYDIVFVATMNTRAPVATNNRSSPCAPTRAPRGRSARPRWAWPCPAGCGMDQVLGQPWLDYGRDRLRGQRDGSTGRRTACGFDIANNGNLLKVSPAPTSRRA
jgi:hypothetical protein